MRVSVVINPRAGSVNPELVEAKIASALFRCDLSICKPQTLQEMSDFLQEEMALKSDYFLICGGDGTINTCLQIFMKHTADWTKIPPIALVRSGTANDLAHVMGISYRIDRAVRSILEGEVKNIDIIEVASEGRKSYMITNGGIGLPALTADLANKVRAGLQKVATCTESKGLLKSAAQNVYAAVKKVGPGVYSMMAIEAIRTWKQEGWELDIQIPGQTVINTTAPIVLVSNQPRIGQRFLPAPYTSNTDGLVNLLLAESYNTPELMNSLMHLTKGTVERSKQFKSFELKDFILRSKNPDRPLTFFGDGEILFKDVAEISIKCLHKGLPVVVNSCRS